MTNDDTMLREVDQALAEDKSSQSLKKNLPLVIGAAALIIAGVGGWQYWVSHKAARSAKQSIAYNEALKATGGADADKMMAAIADEGGAYGALATMREAADLAIKNERAKALELYRSVYEKSAASKRLKDVARLRASYLSLDEGRDAVLKDVGELETDESALGYYAREVIALAALRAGDYQSALEMFRKAATSPDAPETIKVRAEEFGALAAAGKSGVKFPEIAAASTKSESDQYLESLENAGEDLSSLLDPNADASAADAGMGLDDGHDHGAEDAAGEGAAGEAGAHDAIDVNDTTNDATNDTTNDAAGGAAAQDPEGNQ